jgi:hypothetical protein
MKLPTAIRRRRKRLAGLRMMGRETRNEHALMLNLTRLRLELGRAGDALHDHTYTHLEVPK